MRLTFSELRTFLGTRTLLLLAIGVAIGLCLFIVDLVFAFAIQALLVSIGAMDASAARLPSWINAQSLGPILLGVGIIGTLRAAGNWMQIYLKGASAEEAKFHQRTELVERSFRSTSVSAAETTSLFFAHADALGSAIGSLLVICLQATFLLLMGASLALLSPALTAVLVCVLVAWSLLLQGVDRRLHGLGEGLKDRWLRLNGRLLSGIENLLFLHTHGMQKHEADRAQEELDGYHRRALLSHTLAGLKIGANQMLALAMLCSIVLVQRSSHHLPAGTLVSYIYLLMRVLQSFASLHTAYSNVHLCFPQIAGLYRWWKRPETNKRPAPAADAPNVLTESPGWLLTGLQFSHLNGIGPVFGPIDLRVEPGQTLVITGASGSGKTTLINLLLGTLRPTGGKIELLIGCGRRVPLEHSRDSLLRSVGFVGPEAFLIEGSIRNNLFYGLAQTPEPAECRDALDCAGCAFVRKLPDGLDHLLDDQGQGLSAGEKQRLCLARALLRHPKVLILDEPTAHLDGDTEAKILQTLSSLKGSMTIIAATHRSSLLAIADLHLNLPARRDAAIEVSGAAK
ncbi:ABC transporter ATP-binding protein/permease [bacterium]|nr:ABC transporter ATP-binding protein/permease [bacterium]